MVGFFIGGASTRNTKLGADGAASFCSEYHSGSDILPCRIIRAFNNTGAALVAGRPYVITWLGDETKNPTVAVATASLTGTVALWSVVVALHATADQTVDDFVLEGYCDCLVNGTTDVAISDFLRLVPATQSTSLIKDAATMSNQSCAIACAASTANSDNTTRIYLMDVRTALAAS